MPSKKSTAKKRKPKNYGPNCPDCGTGIKAAEDKKCPDCQGLSDRPIITQRRGNGGRITFTVQTQNEGWAKAMPHIFELLTQLTIATELLEDSLRHPLATFLGRNVRDRQLSTQNARVLLGYLEDHR